jgi:hypothetical protein
MFDLNPLTAISREIREWTVRVEQNRSAQDEKTRSALKSLSIAVLETRSYLGKTTSADKTRNLDKEREISALWNEAQINLRLVDPGLAERCFAKADYWADPSLWSDDKVRQYDIELDSMSDAVRGLLAGSGRS